MTAGRADPDELHCWPLRRFGNGFRVSKVVLLALGIRSHIPGRHQPGIVAKRVSAQHVDAPMKATTAALTILDTNFMVNSRESFCSLGFCGNDLCMLLN
jgi:hypothetical protein